MTKLPPEQDISPFYKVVGLLGLAGTIAIGVLLAQDGQHITRWAVGLAALPCGLAVALIRPIWFDRLVRFLMRKLPFTKYQGDGK